MTPMEYIKNELKSARINQKRAALRRDETAMRNLTERIRVLEELEQLCLDSTKNR